MFSLKRKPQLFWCLFIGGSLFSIILLLLRKTGIHCDENNYLRFALDTPFGDSFSSGKPPLFYLANFGVFHSLGKIFGPFRALSVYFTYILLNNIALAWLISNLSLEWRTKILLWVFLETSALFVFNTTQTMMETPLIGILTFVFAGLLFNNPNRFVIPVGVVIATLLKESSLPALFTLLLAKYPTDKTSAKRMLKWIIFSFALAFLLRKLLNIPDQRYGGIFTFLRWPLPFERLPVFLWSWIFFTWPLSIVLLLNKSFERSKDEVKFCLLCGAASLIFSLVTSLSTHEPFVRYTYPTLWISILSLGILLVTLPSLKILALGIASQWILTTNIWFPSNQPLTLWPKFVRDEAVYSGFSVMHGFPTLGWLALSAATHQKHCILISDERGEHIDYLRQYFSWAFTDVALFNRKSLDAFRQCVGERVEVRRFHIGSQPVCACTDASLKLKHCQIQPMEVFFEEPGPVLNVYCSN